MSEAQECKSRRILKNLVEEEEMTTATKLPVGFTPECSCGWHGLQYKDEETASLAKNFDHTCGGHAFDGIGCSCNISIHLGRELLK